MRRICSGCGEEIPEGSDFCYVCGAWAKDAYSVDDEGTTLHTGYCSNCGGELRPGSNFCQYCGAPASDSDIQLETGPRYTARDVVALVLAILPGFFNVFGLGQLALAKWSKAVVYLCATVLFFYVRPSIMLASQTGAIILILVQLAFFVMSVSDVFKTISQRRA